MVDAEGDTVGSLVPVGVVVRTPVPVAERVMLDVGEEVVVLDAGAERVGLVLTLEVRLEEPETVPERVPADETEEEAVLLGDFVSENDPLADDVGVVVRLLETDPVEVGVGSELCVTIDVSVAAGLGVVVWVAAVV